MRRTGDRIEIPGDYQHRALHDGPATQRFWHLGKLMAVEALLDPQPGDVLLDVGCGSGVLAARMAGLPGTRVVGIDANPAAVAFGRSAYAAPNLEFREGLVDDLDLTDLQPNKIAFLEVIEHIYPEQALATLRGFHRLLRPGGRVVVSTPNERSLWPVIEWALDRLAVAPTMAEEQHVASYDPRTLAALGVQAGFRVRDVRTLHLAAPWAAGLSFGLAHRLHGLEQWLRVPFGALVLATFER